MSEEIDHLVFMIAGQPVSKGRPKFGKGRAYTPQKTVDAEKEVRAAYWRSSVRDHGRVVMFEGDVDIAIWFKQSDRRRRDYDNMAKLVTDALNGFAYRDDSQIVRAMITKEYTTDEPYTLVIIKGRVEK